MILRQLYKIKLRKYFVDNEEELREVVLAKAMLEPARLANTFCGYKLSLHTTLFSSI